MKEALKRWSELSLVLRIVVGLVIGVALGLFAPAGIEVITLLGSIFVSALKAVAPVLVFFLVISALANARTAGTMKSVVILYIVGTFAAAVVAVLASFVFPITLSELPTATDGSTAPEGIGEVLTTLVMNIVANPVEALTNANYVGILTWAILLGIALRAAPGGAKQVLTAVSDAITRVVHWVIQLAPFGVLGLAYNAVSTSGVEIFTEYGMLIAVLVGCMLLIAFVVNPLIVFVVIRRNPFPLVLRCLKDSAITAFFTRSSAANIPVNLDLCEKLGLDEGNYSVSIPLGATINMAGASVTIAVLTMAATNTLGIAVDPISAILLCVLTAISACGASGVPGGSLLLIPLACSLFNIDPAISAQMIGVGMIIGVIQDSFETALNSSSDALFTATAEYAQMAKAGLAFEPGKDAAPHAPLAAREA